MKSTLPTDRFQPRGPTRAGTILPPSWRFRRSRRATLLVAAVLCYAIYYAVKLALDAYIAVELVPASMGGIAPNYDPDQYRVRFKSQPTIRLPSKGGPPAANLPPVDVPSATAASVGSGVKKQDVVEEYDGAVRFTQLYSTLSLVGSLGYLPKNRYALFYAENAHAASRLLQMACQMSAKDEVFVHFGLTGKNDIDIEQLIKVNQLANNPDCKLTIHDARADRAMESSPARNKVAIQAALGYFNKFIHPQAVIVDAENEDPRFIENVKFKNQELGQATVELPRNAVQRVPWFPFLDCGGLQAWNNVKIEVLIRADTHTGNLIRLLKSLKEVEYFGAPPTRITVQVPATERLDKMTKEYLRDFNWPSKSGFSLQVLLLDEDTPELRAARMVETFYPKDGSTFLLLLDPNVELSKAFFHYLFYTVLYYKFPYRRDTTYDQLSSISLLAHPSINKAGPGNSVPFLSPLPSANATLIFPEHWMQFHSYTREILRGKTTVDRNIPYEYPKGSRWLELFTQLSYARGWQTLYPAFPEPLAILHEDSPSTPRGHAESQVIRELATSGDAILKLLPDGGKLPFWQDLEWTDWKAQATDLYKVSREASAYRARVSACGEGMEDAKEPDSVDDLFCTLNNKEKQPEKKENPDFAAKPVEAPKMKEKSPPPKEASKAEPGSSQFRKAEAQKSAAGGIGAGGEQAAPIAGAGTSSSRESKKEMVKKAAKEVEAMVGSNDKADEIRALEEVVNWVKN